MNNIQRWHRITQYNDNEGIKYIEVWERYDLDLLKKVKEAKRRPVVPRGEATPLTWQDKLSLAFVSLFGTVLFCIGVAALWYMIIAEAVR